MKATGRFITTITTLGAFLALAAPCRGAVFNVATVAELEAAFLTAASNGEADTVYIAAGNYQPAGQIGFNGSEDYPITIHGAGAGQTIFDGSLITSPDAVISVYQYGTPAAHITVSGLTVQSSGGLGMALNGNSPISIVDSEFTGNSAGGLYTFAPEGDITVERCLFSGNQFPFGDGAGLYGHTMRSYYLRSSVFVNNQATGSPSWGGGGFYGLFDPTTAEHIEIVNNTFVGNSSNAKGGGFLIGMWGSWGTVSIHNNIIRGNTAAEGGNDGDDLWIDPADCNLELFNNDLGNNVNFTTGDSEDLKIANIANYTHSGNITADPRIGAGHHLATGSPCVDAGNDGAPNLPWFDFEGDQRIVGDHVDIGADERAPRVVEVATVPDLELALLEAGDNGQDDVIVVVAGLYQPGAPLAYIASPTEDNSLTIVGAGAGTTILDGGGTTTILDIATDAPSPGIGANVFVQDLRFVGGWSDDPAGGAALRVFATNGNVTVSRCSFENSISIAGGGGAVRVQTAAGAIEFESATFLTNASLGSGGEGGGLLAISDFGTIWLRNCVFFDNVAAFDGGGAALYAGDADAGVVNTTVTLNYADFDTIGGLGGGLKIQLGDDDTAGYFYNSIFWGNDSHGFGDDLTVFSDGDGNGVGATVHLAHSVIGPNADPAAGNGEDLLVTHKDNYYSWACLQQDPLLGPDFRLDPASVCIDAGDDFAPRLPATDFEGEPRIGGSAVDIGADEFHEPPFFEDGFETGETDGWSATVY